MKDHISEEYGVTCILNAHREGPLIFPTIKSIKRSIQYAKKCGISCEFLVILDRPDSLTSEIIEGVVDSALRCETVNFGDLAESRNYAIGRAKGEFCAFLDGDDLWCETWISNAYLLALREKREVVLHPEYNVYFGNKDQHVFRHIDMDANEFSKDFLFQQNYWTALSFGKTDTYRAQPYKKNQIDDGFGYEDWTWNYETVSAGIIHKTVPSTTHFIRRGKANKSLLDLSNDKNVIPRVMPIYTNQSAHEQKKNKQVSAG